MLTNEPYCKMLPKLLSEVVFTFGYECIIWILSLTHTHAHIRGTHLMFVDVGTIKLLSEMKW